MMNMKMMDSKNCYLSKKKKTTYDDINDLSNTTALMSIK